MDDIQLKPKGMRSSDKRGKEITKVQKNDQNPHQQASVQPFLSQQIDNLFVILNYKQQ